MKAPFKLRAYNDTSKPKLKFVVNFRENGRRARRFFESKKEAQTFVERKSIEFENQGREGAEFPSELRIMAAKCAAMLVPYGKSILDATQHYVALLRASAKSGTIAELAAELQSAKKADGASERHLRDIKGRLARFVSDFGTQNAATVTSAQVDDWLRSLSLSAQSRNNYRTVVGAMFNFAVERGYATANPVQRTKKAKVVGGAPGILTVAQSVALLNACEADTLPYVAISLFGGLRAAEMEKLDWSEVDLNEGHIEVTAHKAKTARRRIVPISENLAAWLRPLAVRGGPVAPDGLRKRFDAVKARAGLSKWPPNAMRHSYASYRLTQTKNAAQVSLEMGNSPAMVFAHYRELVKEKDAKRFWQIEPSADTKKIVPLPSAAA